MIHTVCKNRAQIYTIVTLLRSPEKWTQLSIFGVNKLFNYYCKCGYLRVGEIYANYTVTQ
jgi:hypothetical protein